MPGGPRHDQRHQPGQLRVRGPGNVPSGHTCMRTHNTHAFCLRCMTCLAQPRSDLIRVHTEPGFISPAHMHTPPRPESWQVCHYHPFSFRWRAGNHSAFWGMTLDDGIRYRLGTIRPSSSVTNMNEIHVSPSLPCALFLQRPGPIL